MNELNVVNTIVMIVYFFIIIDIFVGIGSLIVMFIKRNKRLDRLEGKFDALLLADKDKKN